jgi:hypothetical protein
VQTDPLGQQLKLERPQNRPVPHFPGKPVTSW